MDKHQSSNPPLQVIIPPGSVGSNVNDVQSIKSQKSQKSPVLKIDKSDLQFENSFGYTQEMPRNRSLASVLFLAVAIAGVPYGLSTTISYPLTATGGSAGVIWGWVCMAVITQCVAISLAEICSRYPVAGGAYYWSYMLSPPRFAKINSYICGWVSLVGNWTVTLAVNFGTTQIFLGAINIFYPDFIANNWQTVLTFWCLTILITLISCIPGKYLKYIDHFCLIWTVAGLIAILIALSVQAKAGRRSARWVFGGFDASGSGWPSGWSFFIGLLQGAYTLSSTGMVASMCEEVREPEVMVPKAIIANISLSFGTGLIYLLPIMFTMPDIQTVLNDGTGQPIPVIFHLVMGYESGAFGLFFIIFLIGIFSGIGCTTAASRLTWAFARDNAIPLSNTFKKVNKKTDVPINAVILSTGIQMLLGCVYFGSSAAFSAFSSVSVICLGCSYGIPILISFLDRRNSISNAKFNLGKFGSVCNMVAIAWFAIAMPLFCFPTTTPTTLDSMNYASVVFVGFVFISGVYYVVHGRKTYAGPPSVIRSPLSD